MKKTILFLSLLFVPVIVFGQNRITSIQDLLSILWIILNWAVITVIAPLSLLFFLWGAALFILHSDNDDKRSEGKKKMFWGIIALVVIFGIWGIIKFLQIAFFGNSPVNPPLLSV